MTVTWYAKLDTPFQRGCIQDLGRILGDASTPGKGQRCLLRSLNVVLALSRNTGGNETLISDALNFGCTRELYRVRIKSAVSGSKAESASTCEPLRSIEKGDRREPKCKLFAGAK